MVPVTDPDWDAIKQVVTDALELPRGERRTWLESRGLAPIVLERAARWLGACERAEDGSFLELPAERFAAPMLADLAEDAHRVPEVLRTALAERYTIERELGRGGMATVYLARDERHGRPVALKVYRQEMLSEAASSSGMLRFQREIAIAARLSHPNILPLHDSGAVEGMLYYITPYASGESLRDLVRRRGRLPAPEAVRILRDVARALAHSHRHGIIHRDIKPGNILLNAEGDALVSDFGVAKALAAASEGDTTVSQQTTAAGLVLGTPAYIAPEQISEGDSVDHRADLYAFGVVAYELLGGSHPFAGRTTQELLAAHLAETPEPLVTRQPGTPLALSVLIHHLLAKRPADRPSDAGAVLGQLDAIIEGRATGGDLPATRGRGQGRAWELYLKGRFLYATRQRDALRGALELFEEAVRLDPEFTIAHAGIADTCTLLGIFGHARPHEIFPRARTAAERAIALDPALPEGHAALGHLLYAYAWDWDAAGRALEHAIALNPRYPAARMYFASHLHALGRSTDALGQLEAARTIDPVAPVGMLSGRIHVDLGEPDLAIPVLRTEVELDPRRDLALQLLGHAYLQKGMAAEAIAAMERAAELSGPRDEAQLAYVLARVGETRRARRVLAPLLDSITAHAALGFHVAMACAALGDSEAALDWLEAAHAERGSFMTLLAVGTGFDGIRAEPRFQALLERMGLGGVVRSGGGVGTE